MVLRVFLCLFEDTLLQLFRHSYLNKNVLPRKKMFYFFLNPICVFLLQESLGPWSQFLVLKFLVFFIPLCLYRRLLQAAKINSIIVTDHFGPWGGWKHLYLSRALHSLPHRDVVRLKECRSLLLMPVRIFLSFIQWPRWWHLAKVFSLL